MKWIERDLQLYCGMYMINRQDGVFIVLVQDEDRCYREVSTNNPSIDFAKRDAEKHLRNTVAYAKQLEESVK